MRTKRFLPFRMMCSMVLSLAACGNQTNASQELDGIFPGIARDVYRSTDDAGEFTCFFLRDDTIEETYYIEFRYGSDLKELQGYFIGICAYWLSAGIDTDASEETILNGIDLFITENLSGE